MHPLSASDLLQLWECGENQRPEEWALTLLAVACPDKTREELAVLSLGQRNALLFTLWEMSFGPLLEAYSECPECFERLEFSLNAVNLRSCDPLKPRASELELTTGRYTIKYRLPNSMDLAEVAQRNDLRTARNILVDRCLREAREGDVEIAAEALPESVIKGMADQMLEIDPLMEIWIDLRCPKCRHRWSMMLDIKSFFWAEISAEAKRLLSEVHSLARACGWREADILAMSTRRRRLYLRMVTS
jgi:hypothetical protein